MQFPAEVNSDVLARLRRVEGQIRGLQRMVDEGDQCRDIMTQLAAARGALDRIGFKLISSALAARPDDADLDELEKLFLKLT